MAVSSRSYQSQVFRRVMAGYGRLSGWGRRQLNTFKLVASWSLQVVLYPVYVGFQSTRLLYRQLRGRSIGADDRPAALAQEAPICDAPIRYLMSALRGSSGLEEPGLTLHPQLPLQLTAQARVACDLSHRSLVIIDRQLQPIALTPSQRGQLQRLIAWLLADYAYRWHQYRQRQRLLKQPLPPVGPPRLAWRPVRQFYQLMGWLQQASVAATINLFQEDVWLPSVIVSSPPADSALSMRSQPRELAPTLPRLKALEGSFETPAALVPRDPAPVHLPAPSPLDDPSWVEAEAVLVGYVDHPLIAVLRWLDEVLLWIEHKAQRLWQRIRS